MSSFLASPLFVMTGNIAKNTLYLTTASIGQKVLAFAYFVFLARIMMPENTGIYFLSVSLTTIFSIIADFGISPVVIREVAKKPDETQQLVQQALGLKVPLLLCAILGSVTVAWALGYDTTVVSLVALAALVTAADSLSLLFYGVLRGHHQLRFESLGIFLGQLITVAVGGLSLWLSPSLYMLIFALIAGSTFNAIFSAVQVVGLAGALVLRPHWKAAQVKRFLRLALPFALAGIFVKLYSYMDTVLISRYIGNVGVGIYAIAYKYTYAFQFVPLAFTAALYPGMSSLLVHDRSKLKSVFSDALWYMLLIGTPIVFGIWAIAPEFVGIVGEGYVESTAVLQTLIFVLIPIFLDFPVGSLLNAADRQTTKTTIMGITMVMNVVLNFFFIPHFGVIGAAYAALISFSFLFLTGLTFVSNILPEFRIAQLGKIALPILLSGAAMAYVVVSVKPFVGFLPAIPIGACAYLLLLLLTRSLTKAHFIQARHVLKR